jgi:hypothetical protein
MFSGANAPLAMLLAGVLSTSLACASDNMDGMGSMDGMPDHGQHSSEFVLFLSAEAHHFTAPESSAELNEDANVIADALLAIDRDRFRLLGEFQLSRVEHDLERFQVGFEPVADTVIWLGRFHQPGSAWNTEHHHGRYLQTSVTRPSVELWEDELGIIPQHITGLMVDSRRQAGDYGGLQLAAGAGFGTTITDQGLDPVDLLDPHFGGRRLALSGRIAYLPDFVGTSAFGLLVSHCDMPVLTLSTAAMLHANRVDQTVYGGFANWNGDIWRLTSAVYDVEMNLNGLAGSQRNSFIAGYAQLERQFPHQLTAYGREENSSRAGDSVYILVNHPDFELRRATMGLRWDFWRRQALTMEAAHGQTSRAKEFEYRLQWSAALP